MSETNITQNRAEASFNKLEELNDSVQCTLSTEQLTEELIKKHDVFLYFKFKKI